ncbi:MAG: DNA polymerase III subunit delta' [Alysiella sp.]|uniref:DNA polymerase III subunit delta' n=1 Tax=Alysiella sp. TaxID=1872483 RepID=UPI0026DC6A45|nr:DNA polymerase III subunit delta' [Alysiella sp.]MDO4434695.1 DNA polymerase III subunit delta' [Alysiella sp.]
MIYIWQEKAWQQIGNHWAQMPHAWLFTGRENTGKTAFACHFAQALLCENPRDNHDACGVCPSCHLFEQGTHPDFYALTPEEPETDVSARKLLQIKIDAVRAVLAPLWQTSVRGGRRVVLVQPAESMNIQAANALLKILEEPPQAVVFLLVTHHKDRVLSTIKSRCRQFALPAPTQAQSLSYLTEQGTENAAALLAFHSGAPLFEGQPEHDVLRDKLLALLAEPRLLAILDYAAEFDKQKWALAVFLDWLDKWLIDVSLVAQNMSPLYYPHHAGAAKKMAEKTNPATLFSLSGSLNRLKPYGHHSLNVKMQIEYLLSEYLSVVGKKSR